MVTVSVVLFCFLLHGYIQVKFMIIQLIISTHFTVSATIGTELSLLARWRGEQTVPHVT